MNHHLDSTSDHFIPLKEVPSHLPKRNGKKTHYSTIYRWATKGVRGQILESTLIGGLRYTTLDALNKFHARAALQDEQSKVVDAIERVLNNPC